MTMRISSHLFLLLVLLALSACQPQNAGSFESPTQVDRIELRDSTNTPLWRLVGDGRSKIEKLEYGVPPPGYTQTYPPQGHPRALNPGEQVVLLWKGVGRFVRHWGQVAAGNVVQYGVWESGPVAGKTDLEIFPDAPKTIDPARGYPN